MSAPSPVPGTATSESERPATEGYKPRVNRYARALINRIQHNRDDVEAIHLLEAHYVEAGDHPSLANLLEGWGDTLSEPRAAADAYLRAADAALVGLGDRARAKTLYERALSRQAGHAEALDRLLRLLADAQDHEREKQVLKYVAYQLDEHGGDPAHTASVLYRLGLVYETHFGEPGKAAASYRKAIERNPRLTPAIVAARRIYSDVGNASAVAVLFDLEVDATVAPEDKRTLLIALAELREHDQHDVDAAVVALRRALKHVPNDVEALRKLGELLVRRSERHGDPAQTAAVADRHRAAEVFFQVGQSIGDPNAKSYFERALSLHPEHERAATALREVAARHDEPTVDFATVAQPKAAVRDSAEAWLHEGEPEIATDVSTDELLPLELSAASEDLQRPSSLPPRELAPGAVAAFPPEPSLRAPRLPQVQPARRSVPPPPPPPRPVASSAPPPPPAQPAATHSAPPPAYAEIPGAGIDDRTPPPSHAPRAADSTLVAWRLPEPSGELAPSDTLHRTDASALAADNAVVLANEPPTRTAATPEPPLAASPARATRSSAPPPPQRNTPYPSQVGSARLRDAQDERVARLMRSIREPRSAPTTLQSPSAALESPAPVAPIPTPVAPIPTPVAPAVKPPRACLVDGELLHDPARTPLEVNLGATTDSNFYVGFDNRLSDGGVFVATYNSLPLGTEVELLVTLPGNFSARAHGRVRLVRDTLEPFGDDVPGMCVELEALSKDALALFERFAQKRAPLFIDD